MGAASSMHTARSPNTRIRIPARNATAANTGSSVTAVPRSGSLAMSASGMKVSTPPMARSPHAGMPRFSPKNLARTSATPILANSDGCRLKLPSAIQRRAPIWTAPKNIT